MVPSGSDSTHTTSAAKKSAQVGRFLVLKTETLCPKEGVTVKVSKKQDKGPRISFTQSKPSQHETTALEAELSQASVYWTVTSAQMGKSGGAAVLVPPGAKTTRIRDDLTIEPSLKPPHDAKSAPVEDISSLQMGTEIGNKRGPNSMQTRLRQFLVESFGGSRIRRHSEQQTPANSKASGGAVGRCLGTGVVEGRHLPYHAHTIGAGSGRSVVANLLQPLTIDINDANSLCSSQPSKFGSSTQPPVSATSSVSESSGSCAGPEGRPPSRPHNANTLPSEVKQRTKSRAKGGIKRLWQMSSSKRRLESCADNRSMPDPAKLPKEQPNSSIVFTQSRLKNMTTKNTSRNPIKKGKSHEGPSDHSLLRQGFLLGHMAKSEELLLGNLVYPQPQQHGHHHHHHHHHWHRHHSHYKRGHHSSSSHHHNHHPMSLTRVTENRRYLMFIKQSPFRSPSDYLQTRGKGMTDSQTYSVLFKHTTCYELMPESAKLVTLDSRLPISTAFRALCVNGLRAAPVWDSQSQTFMGTLSITDFLQMLKYCWKPPAVRDISLVNMGDLELLTISQWKELSASVVKPTVVRRESGAKLEMLHSVSVEDSVGVSTPGSLVSLVECSSAESNEVHSAPAEVDDASVSSASSPLMPSQVYTIGGLISVGPDESIFKALSILHRMHIHRLPIFDNPWTGSGNPLFVLTHRCLLDYLYKKQNHLPFPKYLNLSIKDAGVGTYEDLSLITHNTSLLDALLFYEDESISVLPIVDNLSNCRLVDIFAKFDIITLILAGMYKNPDMTVKEVSDICKSLHRGVVPDTPIPPDGPSEFAVETCLPTDTIQFVLNKLMRTGYHRLIVINNCTDRRVEGMVSISDLLYYMVLKQADIVPLPIALATKPEPPDWWFLPSQRKEHDSNAVNLKGDYPIEYNSQPETTVRETVCISPIEPNFPEVDTLTHITEEGVSTQSVLATDGRQNMRPFNLRRVSASIPLSRSDSSETSEAASTQSSFSSRSSSCSSSSSVSSRSVSNSSATSVSSSSFKRQPAVDLHSSIP